MESLWHDLHNKLYLVANKVSTKHVQVARNHGRILLLKRCKKNQDKMWDIFDGTPIKENLAAALLADIIRSVKEKQK